MFTKGAQSYSCRKNVLSKKLCSLIHEALSNGMSAIKQNFHIYFARILFAHFGTYTGSADTLQIPHTAATDQGQHYLPIEISIQKRKTAT